MANSPFEEYDVEPSALHCTNHFSLRNSEHFIPWASCSFLSWFTFTKLKAILQNKNSRQGCIQLKVLRPYRCERARRTGSGVGKLTALSN